MIGLKRATTATSDVVDASLAVLAEQLNDTILTTDPDDMADLVTQTEELLAGSNDVNTLGHPKITAIIGVDSPAIPIGSPVDQQHRDDHKPQ